MRMCNNMFEDSRHRLGRIATVANRTKHPHEKEKTKTARSCRLLKSETEYKNLRTGGAPKTLSEEL